MRGKTRLMVIVAVAAFLLATAVALRVQQLGQVATVTITVTRFGATAQSPDVVENVCFSRVSACDVLLYEVLRSAERKVLVAVYPFTSDLLADGLIHAVKRGVEESQQVEVRGSEYIRLKDAGVDVKLDGNPHLMHYKFMVADSMIVMTGSYNWSRAAEDLNDENVVFLKGREVVELFELELAELWRSTT
ncbi:MAG: phospholipase D-like domain-containing protein [Candidatus Caldarchaeum sp.]